MQIDRGSCRRLNCTFTQANTGNLPFPEGVDGVTGLIETLGYNGAVVLCIEKTGTGTCTVTPQSQYDRGGASGTFYSIGYQRTDGQTSLTRAVGGISIPATNPFPAVYQILDFSDRIQFAVSAITGSFSINAYLLASPL